MNRQFDPVPMQLLQPAAMGFIAFSGAMIVDLLPLLLLAFGYNTIARVVSR